MTNGFIPAIQLCESYYWHIVRPILDREFVDVPHAAALLGNGSEVLGYDTALSTDHDWTPRVVLFVNEDDCAQNAAHIEQALEAQVPETFAGYATRIELTHSPGVVNQRSRVHTWRTFTVQQLGVDASQSLTQLDWLVTPQQQLLSVTAGAVYHDAIGLQRKRDQLAWYPHDVWLYQLAAGWTRIGQEEHLMGRAGSAGDEIGSALIGARLARDIMRMCFLMERVYAPYSKWFGTAFKRLQCASVMEPWLANALTVPTWQEREQHLVRAYEHLAAMHNALGLTQPLPTNAISFFDRPFRVIALHGFVDALLAQLQEPTMKRIAARRCIGAIDQFSDNTDLLEAKNLHPVLKLLYDE